MNLASCVDSVQGAYNVEGCPVHRRGMYAGWCTSGAPVVHGELKGQRGEKEVACL